jgi:hypothetical protein
MIVAEDADEVAGPKDDSHVVKIKSLNADVFVDVTENLDCRIAVEVQVLGIHSMSTKRASHITTGK